jgi:hypothetical protein
MAHPVIHWEIGGREGEKLARFYEDLFGWAPQPAGEGYWLIAPEPPGIGGGILEAQGELPAHVTIYVHTRDLEETLDRVTIAGGRTIRDPQPIPGIGRFALFEDPEGNVIGLLETTEEI